MSPALFALVDALLADDLAFSESICSSGPVLGLILCATCQHRREALGEWRSLWGVL